jgi:hypothetical protein
MIGLSVNLVGDGAFPDLIEKDTQGLLLHGRDITIAGLAGGMTSGKPSVAIRIDCADGRVVFAETSLTLLVTAVEALVARYGDPRTAP